MPVVHLVEANEAIQLARFSAGTRRRCHCALRWKSAYFPNSLLPPEFREKPYFGQEMKKNSTNVTKVLEIVRALLRLRAERLVAARTQFYAIKDK